MRKYKIHFSSFIKNIVIFILFLDFLYAQNNEIKSDPYIFKIKFAPRVGMSINDYVIHNHVKSYLLGMDINVPLDLNYLRFQYNHHFLKYDKNYSDMPKNFNRIYRNEIILSYFYKIDLEGFYLGLSGGLGYCEEKNAYNFTHNIHIPITFEIGMEINKLTGLGFEIRKNIFIEQSSYFLGTRFEIRPF